MYRSVERRGQVDAFGFAEQRIGDTALVQLFWNVALRQYRFHGGTENETFAGDEVENEGANTHGVARSIQRLLSGVPDCEGEVSTQPVSALCAPTLPGRMKKFAIANIVGGADDAKFAQKLWPIIQPAVGNHYAAAAWMNPRLGFDVSFRGSGQQCLSEASVAIAVHGLAIGAATPQLAQHARHTAGRNRFAVELDETGDSAHGVLVRRFTPG